MRLFNQANRFHYSLYITSVNNALRKTVIRASNVIMHQNIMCHIRIYIPFNIFRTRFVDDNNMYDNSYNVFTIIFV